MLRTGWLMWLQRRRHWDSWQRLQNLKTVEWEWQSAQTQCMCACTSPTRYLFSNHLPVDKTKI